MKEPEVLLYANPPMHPVVRLKVRKHTTYPDALSIAHVGGDQDDGGLGYIRFDPDTPEHERMRAAETLRDLWLIRWGPP